MRGEFPGVIDKTISNMTARSRVGKWWSKLISRVCRACSLQKRVEVGLLQGVNTNKEGPTGQRGGDRCLPFSGKCASQVPVDWCSQCGERAGGTGGLCAATRQGSPQDLTDEGRAGVGWGGGS